MSEVSRPLIHPALVPNLAQVQADPTLLDQLPTGVLLALRRQVAHLAADLVFLPHLAPLSMTRWPMLSAARVDAMALPITKFLAYPRSFWRPLGAVSETVDGI
jgi:hypothetical protein